MKTHRTVYIVSLAVLVLGLAGAGWLTVPIDRHRHKWVLTYSQQMDTAAPPWVTLASAGLGSFRGLAVHALWYRADRLQSEGKYFDANQLAHLITTLQPRFPQVWSYQAWNMAYNISVATHTPQERWHWVNQGIALLRDKGIVYNPTAVGLYRELGWIYFHKFGKFMDDMHWYYRQQLAIQWHQLIGGVPPGATTQEVLDGFAMIVDAPDSIDLLIKDHPKTEMLLDRLRALGYGPDQSLLRQIGRVRMFGDWAAVRADPAQDDFDNRLARVLADPAWAGVVEPFLACLRKQVLKMDYHMDPLFMFELMERYGPLDWRHPVSHGCYWSEMGVKMATGGHVWGDRRQLERMTEIDLLNTNRQTIHTMQELARSGKIALDPLTGHVDLMPDPRFVPAYDRAVELAKQRIDSGAFGYVGKESFDQGHENFLLEAMVVSYLYGDTAQAQHYYKKVRNLYGQKPHNLASGRYRKTMAEFVTDQLRGNLEMMSSTSQFIHAMLNRAIDGGLAYNQLAVFERFIGLARLAHIRYQQDKAYQPAAPQGRLRLLPFDQVVTEAYLSYMGSSDISLLKRSRVWGNTPLTLKRRVVDRLLPMLQAQAKQAGFVPEGMFPPLPVGDRSRGVDPKPAVAEQAPVQIQRQ